MDTREQQFKDNFMANALGSLTATKQPNGYVQGFEIRKIAKLCDTAWEEYKKYENDKEGE